ncbi:hypothetical protein LEP1GSC185_2910 [Leptospira licerasiae serovar Varillal str. VAR 010]|uniref:Uncharacterized protein n=1 Tax=Leptospira licerasiae str. MMD4847 TaxID=1049971 RepID=A0ABN0HAE9_9LEPT|nr:hypothetical protein LEP1GSC185_2910 [Leptospira licerasiae serovar Varillal str. VAR 010]EJZ42558.1 hypothetical protein LEP1GSC178_2525 [Leptospira licerasiae str. MMD4847]
MGVLKGKQKSNFFVFERKGSPRMVLEWREGNIRIRTGKVPSRFISVK